MKNRAMEEGEWNDPAREKTEEEIISRAMLWWVAYHHEEVAISIAKRTSDAFKTFKKVSDSSGAPLNQQDVIEMGWLAILDPDHPLHAQIQSSVFSDLIERFPEIKPGQEEISDG